MNRIILAFAFAAFLQGAAHAQLPPTVAIPDPDWRMPLRDAPMVIDDSYQQSPPIIIQLPEPDSDDDKELCRKAKECRDRALHPKWYAFKRNCRKLGGALLRPVMPMFSRMTDFADMGP